MRVSHLAAMATLVALLGAMFVAMGSVSAVSVGACDPDGTTMLGIGDTCTITVVAGTTGIADPLDSDGNGGDSAVTLDKEQDQIQSSNDNYADVTTTAVSGTTATVTANGVGSATITYNDYTAAVADDPQTVKDEEAPATMVSKTYSISVQKIAVTKIEFGAVEGGTFVADSDEIFGAGTDVTVRVTISYPNSRADDGSTLNDTTPDNDIQVTLTVPSTGLSLTSGTGQRQTVSVNPVTTGKSPTTTADFTLLTDGAPDGTYVVTATATQGHLTPDPADLAQDPNQVLSNSAKFTDELTISDAGNFVKSASLDLGLKEGPPDANAANDMPESGSVGRTGSVNLVLSITNGIDNPVNAADVDEIRIVAPFGDVKYYATNDKTSAKDADPTNIVGAVKKGSVVINVASSGQKPRTIDVYAIVLGKAGVATTETVSLNFTGDAASVDLADATENLRSINLEDEMDSIKLMVTAADTSGNTAAVPDPLTITVHDPDGKQLATSGTNRKIDAERMAESGKVFVKVTNRSGNNADTALKVGEYTVKVTSGSINESAMFMVVGGADALSIEADNMAPSEIAEHVVVTATVNSGDQPVADGTVVTFRSRDTTGDSDSVLVATTSETPGTKGGVATATYVVIGAGSAVVTATADGQVDVVVVESTAGMVEPEAMPEEEASVSCLSELSGFATWSCGVSADASEIFGMVSARGVSAIHLWNGSTWVRYSVVDDAMVPGSSDFMVTENDILYISN